MKLSSTATLAFIGLCCIYMMKIVDTLFHGIIVHPAFPYVLVSLNIIGGIAQLLFFVALTYALQRVGGVTLLAGWLGVMGSAVNMLPKFLALSMLAQYDFLMDLLKHGQLLAIVSLWSGAYMLFCCCLILFWKSAEFWHDKAPAFLSGAAGYLVLTTVFSILVYNYMTGAKVNWSRGETGTTTVIFILSSTTSFLCIAYFYASFINGKK